MVSLRNRAALAVVMSLSIAAPALADMVIAFDAGSTDANLQTVSGGDLFKPLTTVTSASIGSNATDTNLWGTGSTAGATGPDINSTWRASALFKVGTALNASASDPFAATGDLAQRLNLTLTLKVSGTGPNNSAGFAPLAAIYGVDTSASGTTGWWGTADLTTQSVSSATALSKGTYNATDDTWTFNLSVPAGFTTADTGDIIGIAIVGNENAIADESITFAETGSTLTIAQDNRKSALIDFSAAASTPGGAVAGNHWNTVGNTAVNNLIEVESGVDSGWNVQVTDGGGATGFGGTAIDGDGDGAPFDQSFAIIDGIFSNQPTAAGTATITFTDLEPDTDYDFVTYSDRDTSWADGIIATTIGTGPSSLLITKDVVTRFRITSNGSGTLAFTFVEDPSFGGPSGLNAVLNALRITEVPAPSALPAGLALLGLAAMCRRRAG